MYHFQDVKTRVGRKPLSYFVLATPYSICSLNFYVTACQVKKMKERTLTPKTYFTSLCCYMICCGLKLMCEKVDWIHLAQDGGQWWTVGSTNVSLDAAKCGKCFGCLRDCYCLKKDCSVWVTGCRDQQFMLLPDTDIVTNMSCLAPTTPPNILPLDGVKHLNLEQMEYFSISSNGSEDSCLVLVYLYCL